MRIVSIVVIGVFVLAVQPGRAQAAGWENLPGWSVTKTGHSYKALVERVTAAVKANRMGLVTRASASAGAAARGKTIPGNMVVGIYRNDFALRMLEASIPAGIEAPIRVYITEHADGAATLSYKTPSAVFAPYRDGGRKLTALAKELDTIFAKIARQATAP